MKKSLMFAVGLIFSGATLAWAGHFTDILPPASTSGCVPVSNGYDYNCTTDTSAPGVAVSSKTLSALQTFTPSAAGQIFFCATCTQTPVCVSTGTGAGAFVAVSVSTGATTGFGTCR